SEGDVSVKEWNTRPWLCLELPKNVSDAPCTRVPFLHTHVTLGDVVADLLGDRHELAKPHVLVEELPHIRGELRDVERPRLPPRTMLELDHSEKLDTLPPFLDLGDLVRGDHRSSSRAHSKAV